MEPPSSLVVDGTAEDEVLLSLYLLKTAKLDYPVRLVNLVIALYPKPMGAYSELA
jgi:hypothetical protein